MPQFYACDHCGRTGVTFGVYYPGRDMSQPPVRLCQTKDGIAIEPSCYHLVTVMGEPLGLRKTQAILDTDRHSPKVEAVALRFTEDAATGTVLTETERPGEVVAQEHPLTGEVVRNEPAEITQAEANAGLTNVDQFIPLVMPGTEQANAIADAAAAEQAAKITVPAGMGGQVGYPADGPDYTNAMEPKRYPRGATAVYEDRPLTDEEVMWAQRIAAQPESSPAATYKSAAQVALEAQARADAREAAKARPEKRPAARKAAAKSQPRKKETP